MASVKSQHRGIEEREAIKRAPKARRDELAAVMCSIHDARDRGDRSALQALAAERDRLRGLMIPKDQQGEAGTRRGR